DENASPGAKTPRMSVCVPGSWAKMIPSATHAVSRGISGTPVEMPHDTSAAAPHAAMPGSIRMLFLSEPPIELFAVTVSTSLLFLPYVRLRRCAARSDPALQPVVQADEPGRHRRRRPHRVPERGEQHTEDTEHADSQDAAGATVRGRIGSAEQQPDH